MLSAYQLCFVVFLATLHQAQLGESSSHFNNTEELTGGEGFSNYGRCTWNCKVIEPTLPKPSDFLFSKTSLIQLVVNYETKVDKKCANQTSRSSSGIVTEDYEVWQPATNTLPSFANGIKSVFNLISGYSISRDKDEIKAVCNFKPARTTAPSPKDVRVELQKSIEEMDYIIITKKLKKEGRPWSESLLKFLFLVSSIAFAYYSPAFLCLFCPTAVKENGVRYIAIKGASPVSIQGAIGNNLLSEDCTTWRGMAEMLILRLVVLPLTFLSLATIVVHYLLPLQSKVLDFLHFTHPFMIACFACYFIWAVYDSFVLFSDVPHEAKPCELCLRLKSNLTCVDVLPQRILNHLRIQPLLLVECWRVFIRSLVRYFKTIIFYSLKCSAERVVRIPLFIIFISTVPVATIMLLAYLLISLCLSIIHTSPLMTIMRCRYRPVTKQTENGGSLLNCLLALVKRVGYICLIFLAFCGSGIILSLAAHGVLHTSLLALTIVLLFPEESLPFVACFVLVFYYLFSSYSSFTDKYHDLSVKLFKCFKKSREELCTEPVQEVTPNSDNKDNMTIPKELFDMACEELMPIREGVCILVLKVSLILCFVFVVFLLTMRLDVGATPLTKALVTFATGTFPKIIAIYFDGERQRNLQAMIIEDKAPKILQEYLNRNHRANQEENCGAITDEVIFNHGTEENIELLNTGYEMVSETDETPV